MQFKCADGVIVGQGGGIEYCLYRFFFITVHPRQVVFHGLAAAQSLQFGVVTEPVDVLGAYQSALIAVSLSDLFKHVAVIGHAYPGCYGQADGIFDLNCVAVEFFKFDRVGDGGTSRASEGYSLEVFGSHHRPESGRNRPQLGSEDDSCPHQVFPGDSRRHEAYLVAVFFLQRFLYSISALPPEMGSIA
ncbi:hypothetical protein ES703_125736 [subsurface metagenome]